MWSYRFAGMAESEIISQVLEQRSNERFQGPLGPKTLCNACGLRWAKQMRKYDEPVEGAIPHALDAPSN